MYYPARDSNFATLSDANYNHGNYDKCTTGRRHSTCCSPSWSPVLYPDLPHAIPGRLFASIYQEWIRCYGDGTDNDPASLVVDFGHFLAHPVQVMPTGPTTISGVLHAHRSLCAQAYELSPDSFSLPSGTSSHSLPALYRALVVIVDKIWKPLEGYQRESDGLESMHNFALNQTVIIACTGANAGLSAPISLESLKKESFPLEASLPDDDIALCGNEAIRVSLSKAVQFITSLEKREILANPNLQDEKGAILHDDRLDPRLPKEYEGDSRDRHRPDSCTDAILIMAEKYGYYNILSTRSSLQRVQAALVGNHRYELRLEPWEQRWNY